MLIIDPDECIDCGACIPECPVEAIYHDEDVPEEMDAFIELNARLSASFPIITETQNPHPEEAKYKDVVGKRHLV